MMDDAINVHGIYLKVDKRVDDHTLEASYGTASHGASVGVMWAMR